MARVGRLNHKTFLNTNQKRFFSHNPQYSLMIDLLSFPVKCMGYASIAISWKFQNNLFNPITQHCFFLIILWLLYMSVIPTSAHLKKMTQIFSRKFWLVFMHLFYHRITFLGPILFNVFFTTLFSTPLSPQNSSNSPI